MNGWLLDTNVVSELRKANADRRVTRWVGGQPAHLIHLSRVTLAEIRFGIERAADPAFVVVLTDWLERTLRPWIGTRLLDIDEDVILEWRRMVERGRARGVTFSQPDLFIAATARVHDLVVVTRNVRDFEIAQVPVVDPWRARGRRVR